MALPVDLRVAWDIKVSHTAQLTLSLEVRKGGREGGRGKERTGTDRDRQRKTERET